VRRLARYILAELALVACALVGVAYAASAVFDRWEQRAEEARAAATALLPRGEISDPPDPSIADEPTGSFLGMSDELLLDRVRRQPIVRVKLNHGGSSLSFRVEFADGKSWMRKDWNAGEIKTAYQRAMATPWAPNEMCRAL